jgi:hypothetical protein
VRKESWLDSWVPWLLLFGAFALGIGWIVGVVGLWQSDAWSLRDKILGTLVWPGGIVAPLVLSASPASVTSCVNSVCVTHGYVLPWWIGVPAMLVSVGLPIVLAVHLIRTRATNRRLPSGVQGDGF